MNSIPFVDLDKQLETIRPQIDKRLNDVLNHGFFIKGPEVKELEADLSKFCGAKHSIACANGTDALMIAMMAIDIQPGDEIITTPFTFFATGETISLLGAKAVFVDIDPDTYNIDEKLIEEKITKKTKAIIPVSLYGLCSNLHAIQKIADQKSITVIEDAAQSFGAKIDNDFSCNISNISTTSFFPAKPLGCYGDGGAIFTNDDALAEKIISLSNHGQTERYTHHYIGVNSRLDTMQAAILIEKLKIFPKEIELRNLVAQKYDAKLKDHFKTQKNPDNYRNVYAQYTLEISNREEFIPKMKAEGIPISVHYPKCLHHQPIYQKLGYNDSCPIAESAAKRVISLPMHPYVSDEHIEYISKKVLEHAKA